MRALFGVAGLLLVLAIVAVLAKKQWTAGVAPRAAGAPAGTSAPAANPRQQVQQFNEAVQGAIQARPMPDEEK